MEQKSQSQKCQNQAITCTSTENTNYIFTFTFLVAIFLLSSAQCQICSAYLKMTPLQICSSGMKLHFVKWILVIYIMQIARWHIVENKEIHLEASSALNTGPKH